MSRRHGQYGVTPGKGTAFTSAVMSDVIHKGIGRLRAKMEAIYPVPEVSADEVYNTFVPHEDITVCKRARVLGLSKYSWNEGFNHNITVKEVPCYLGFYSDGNNNCYPEKTGKKVYEDRSDMLPRLTEWAREVLDIRLKFVQITATFTTMNRICKTPQQVRYYLPSIMTVIAAANVQGKITEELRSGDCPRFLPSLPMDVIEQCKIANGMLATTQLVPEAPKNNPSREIRIALCNSVRVRVPPFDGDWSLD